MLNIKINKEDVKIEGNNLIIKITEENKIELQNSFNIGKKQLGNLSIGDIIVDNVGVEWIVIRHDEDGSTKVWRKELLEDKRIFDANSNNFKHSEIKKFLNEKYLKEAEQGFGSENILGQDVDLTSLDGLTTYGEDSCKIRLGGLDDYRNARKQGLFREQNGHSFWLDTPDSTDEGYSTSYVQFVCSNGSVDFSNCRWGSCSVRPFLSLPSTIFVSCK